MTLIILILIAVCAAFILYYRRGLRFVLSYLGVVKISESAVTFKETTHKWKSGQLGRIHEFSPAKKQPSSVIIFVTGISRDGLDDARLKKMARSLAYSGKVAILAEFTDFAAYKMSGAESEKLVETIAIAKERYPQLKYGIGAVCLGGIVSLIALTKLSKANFPTYIYLHGVFLDHTEMVRHTCKETPTEDRPPLSYAELPPDPLGKAVVLYNSKNFLGTLKNGPKCERALLKYISTVKDSDSHVEFRDHLKELDPEDIRTITGEIDPAILSDVDASSPNKFLATFEFPKDLKIYQSHTTDDDVIPLELGVALYDFLRSKGANVTFATSDIGHGGEVSNVLGQLRFFKFTLGWSNY